MTDQAPLDYDPLKVPTRPAATVMLVRDAERSGVEVFMMRRTAAAVFAASQYVFPGGKVDDVDHAITMERWCDGRTDASSSALLQVPAGGLSFWVAAIRECFEEAGVLLARPATGTGVVSFDDPDVARRFSGYRDALNAGTLDLVELCRREELRLITDAIGYVSHWITPIGPPRRFDARFFIARAPQAQEPLHDDNETVESIWMRPAEALDRFRAGTFAMFPPTASNLEFLASHSSADAALAAAMSHSKGAPAVHPKVKANADGQVVVSLFPGDPGYDSAPDYEVID